MKTNNPLNIFLVDDDLYCLNLFGRYLNYLGHTHIQYFTKSSECLDQLPLRPDLVFLDYQVDNLNGIQLLRKIKRFDPRSWSYSYPGRKIANMDSKRVFSPMSLS